MNLTKKWKAAITQVYNAYWQSYLKVDMKTMTSLLEHDFKVID